MHSNRFIRFFFLLPLLLATSVQALYAQSAFDPAYREEAEKVKDYMEVFTDRSMYVVNEKIRFWAKIRVEGLGEDIAWSDVVYMELVSDQGQEFFGSKYPVKNGLSRGGFTIPSDVITGNYYLKCYTRWMRNSGPAFFSYVPVKIINPYRSEVEEYADITQRDHTMERTPYGKGVLDMISRSSKLNRGEKGEFSLSITQDGTTEPIQCCVTIAPAIALDTAMGQFTRSRSSSEGSNFSLNYLPDMGGASISGRLIHEDGTPGAYGMLHFSLLGSDQGYFVTGSDGEGRFVISTHGSEGEQEIFVAAKAYGDQEVEVMIDQDFDQEAWQMPGQVFELSGLELEVATQMAMRMQLSRTFEKKPSTNPLLTDTVKEEMIPFYGTPDFQMELDQYVDLPNLEEVFTNLVTVVDVVRKRGKLVLLVESENHSIAAHTPLVLIDHIPVFDLEAVMDLATEKIRKIDVINEVYVKGNVSFGGVISILSWKGDMAGIDLPQGSYFFDFQSLEPPVEERNVLQEPGDRIPDTRNTILWLDDVSVKRGSPYEFTCIMPDQPGQYIVFARGVTPGGKVHSASARITVDQGLVVQRILYEKSIEEIIEKRARELIAAYQN